MICLAITLVINFYIPIATGLIGDAELPSVINGNIITHDNSTLSFAKPFRLKFSKVCITAFVKK